MHKLANNQKAYDMLAAGLKSGRLSHAILLEGPGGCGKLTFAKEIAQGLLCTAPPPERPCGTCRDCVKADKDVHPDILIYEGEGSGSRSFHVETVREIRAQAYVMPNEGNCKVLILRDVHNMTVQSQNALLKIIEDPPKNVHFILTCENKAALLPTVLSRISAVSLAPPEAENEESRYGQAAEVLTALCTGGELDALAVLTAYEKDRQGLQELLGQMKTLCADILSGRDIGAPEAAKLRKRVTSLQFMRILGIIEELCEAVSGNVNGLLLVTVVCSKIKQVVD